MTVETLRRVLVVEDEPDIQAILRLSLGEVGKLEVEICSSGAEAVERAHHFKPDLLLVDVMMPGMDGPTTVDALRQLPDTKDTPVIFLTAKVQVHEVERYLALGALSVIAKPFDPVTLARDVIAGWENRQR